MPSSKALQQHGLTVSNFGFSAVNVNELEATEYTLVTIACDVSSSVASFDKDMEKCLKEIVEACRKSPRADNLMLRLLVFHSSLEEIHGFKPLMDCNSSDYTDCLPIGGMTALVDATVNAVEALDTYGKDLVENEYDCNGILVVITDGCENNSTNTVNQAKKAVQKILKQESLESLVSILIGVNTKEADIGIYLADYKDKVGFTQYVDIEKADAKTLAKLAKFISQSISSQSQALGTGGPSQSLSF